MVHDNIIKSYHVDFENKDLTMKTEYETPTLHEKTDVVFTGYLTHIFSTEMECNIIFDIEEWPLALFLKEESELLKDEKNYGWPISYDTEADLIGFFTINGYKVFNISSSCGLHGYVLAKSMEIKVIKLHGE